MLPASILQLVNHIVQQSQPRRVILFGSRARGTHRPTSDVDLCVVGRTCPDEVWTKLLVSIAEDPHTLLRVDLVEFEKLGPDYQEEIRKEGKVLHESNG